MTGSGSPPPGRSTSDCILVVEDRDDDALFLKRSLRKAGITVPVKIVQDGALAVSYLQGDDPFSDRTKFPIPSVVMLDIQLPNKNGFEVLEWLRAQPQFKHLFVAMVTVTGKIDDITRAYRLGANSFLTKPCHAEDIRELAQNFPSHWSTQAARTRTQRTRLAPLNSPNGS